MPRFLVQVDLERLQQARLALQAIPQLRLPFLKPVFGYLIVDVAQGQLQRLAAIPGVVAIKPDRRVSILQKILPVNRELQALLSSPLALFATASPRSDVWPTGESRKAVGADVAEAEGITGKGVKVAILDTGRDIASYQLPRGQVAESTVQGQPLPQDENGHGSHVATTIAGQPFSHPFGLLKGVAPGAELIHIKVLGYGLGFGSMSDILVGMQRAAELGANIVSMSLGGEDTDDPEAPELRAVKMLTERGIICVIAAGNSGPDANTIGSPGSAPDALTIGAVDKDGSLADFSSRGPTELQVVKPDVTAPGVNILSESAGFIATYRFIDLLKAAAISGTSMATPHTSGAVALALEYARSKGKLVTTAAIKDAMATYGKSKDNETGFGPITYQVLKKYINEVL